MAQYSPWYEEYTKYPYRKNPVSIRTRYKNFIIWLIKSYWLLIVFTVIGLLAISLEAYLQHNWHIWIFQNPFSNDVFANNAISIFTMSLAWLSVIPTALLFISFLYAIPQQAEEMLASPTDTSGVGDWIRRSYELIPFMLSLALFAIGIEKCGGWNRYVSWTISGVVIFICIFWYPIYEKFFKNGNTNQ